MSEAQTLEKAVVSVLGSQTWMVRTLVMSDAKLAHMPFGTAALTWLRRHMPLAAARVERAAARATGGRSSRRG